MMLSIYLFQKAFSYSEGKQNYQKTHFKIIKPLQIN